MQRLALTPIATLAVLAALAPAASANTITVDTTSDLDTVDNKCSLREAMLNARNGGQVHTEAGECGAGLDSATPPAADTIDFASNFNGEAADTIAITPFSPLTEVLDTLTINGGDCDPGPAPKPCVGLTVSDNGIGPATNGTNGNLTVTGLSISNGGRGLGQANSNGSLTVKGSWVGVKLDGTADGMETGLLLQGQATIGGTAVQDRNVISGNGIGIEILRGVNNTVEGNYFGVEPDGDAGSGMSNGVVNISVLGVGSSNNQIGGPDSGTPTVCDGACNLLANAGNPFGDGIDLTGGGGVPSAGPTRIEGNFIGLSLDGTQAMGNGGHGISVGSADNVAIGNGTVAGRNYIADNGFEDIHIQSGANNLSIDNNYIGLNAAGTAKLPTAAASEIHSQASSMSITDNRIGGKKLNLLTSDSTLKGNVFGVGVGGQDVGTPSSLEGGLYIVGDNNVIGGSGVGEGNTVGNVDFATAGSGAVRVTGSGNDVIGNLIGEDAGGNPHPNGANGIRIGLDGDFTPLNNNQIGGSAPGEGNVISNSASNAIRIAYPGTISNGNTFVGNTGRNNGLSTPALFIDLADPGQGNTTPGPSFDPPPNGGIQAPVVTVADITHIAGTSPEADGTSIEVYRTGALLGNVRSYLGSTTVSSGAWTFTYPTALKLGNCVTAAQTANTKGTSELAPVSVIGSDPDCDVMPPVATPLSNAFTIGELDGRTLTLNVSSAGTVEVTDAGAQAAGSDALAAAKKKLKTSSASGGPGTIAVPLALTKSAKKALRTKGKLKLNAQITFTPTGGLANSQTAALRLKGKKK